MKIIIFGTGIFYKNRKDNLRKSDIIAFIDNAPDKQGTILDGCLILSVERGIQLNFDYIVLMARQDNKRAMEKQLLDMGVDAGKIIDYEQYLNCSRAQSVTIYYNGQDVFPKEGKKILLLSHELSMTGAPIVLFNAALIMKKNGYHPVFMSLRDGELRDVILEQDIPVVIEKNIMVSNKAIWNWMLNFDLVWVNTLSFSNIIDDLSRAGVPAVWWLHEGDISYEIIGMNKMPKTEKIIDTYAVGTLAIDSYKKNLNREGISCLLYGIPDEKPEKKIRFVLSGTISERKAQDVFVDAILLLEDNVRNRCDFVIVGNVIEQHIYDQIVAKARGIRNLHILEPVSHEEMLRMYESIDVVVCPSRLDPMPVVVTEGLMNRKICIVSEQTGFTDIITDGKNGIICKVNAENLAEKITWVVNNFSGLSEMRDNARKLYMEKFSMDIFEKNILDILTKNFN
ncbi:MAG TPA: glycosyltransferase family 4 protein [Candidatus Eisenbergiella pullicola]|nr:glycosyltransferase family 4 protein [Candidatus Eisenbergiella pullicola]